MTSPQHSAIDRKIKQSDSIATVITIGLTVVTILAQFAGHLK